MNELMNELAATDAMLILSFCLDYLFRVCRVFVLVIMIDVQRTGNDLLIIYVQI